MHFFWFRILPVVLFSWFASSAVSQSPKSPADTLSWTAQPRLHYNQFQARPDVGDNLATQTPMHQLGYITTSITVNFTMQGKNAVFNVYALMKPSASWIRRAGDTVTLQHEQGHFDLCEIYARRLRRDLQQAPSLAAAKTLFEKAVAAEAKEQETYDAENTYGAGGITPGWKTAIANRLNDLKNYSLPVVRRRFTR